MPADPARQAALALLTEALARKGGLESALESPELLALAPRDRAFARALAMAALRRLGPIDRALDGLLDHLPPAPVRMILRLGAAQMSALAAPPYAAVDASVELAAASRATRGFRGLVNAVLRRLSEREVDIRPEDLAPAWLFARWRAAYGEADARRIAETLLDEPSTDVTPRDPSEAAAIAADLEGEVLPGGAVRRSGRGRIEDWPGFAEGRWWVQDAAAAVPARLLTPSAGEPTLDLCAAPGGKALQLAAAGAALTALDRSGPRLRRLRDSLKRTRLAAEVVVADAAAWTDARTFDAVLLDAPCASSGVFRRNPDVLWTLRPADIVRLAEVQARLLAAAAARTRVGGRLVYCVCSLEPEEGEGQARAFLQGHSEFKLDPPRPGEGGAPAESLTADGWLRILPFQAKGGVDGFFVARFTRAR